MKTIIGVINNLFLVFVGIHHSSPLIIMLGVTIILLYISYEIKRVNNLMKQHKKEKEDWLNRNLTKK